MPMFFVFICLSFFEVEYRARVLIKYFFILCTGTRTLPVYKINKDELLALATICFKN